MRAGRPEGDLESPDNVLASLRAALRPEPLPPALSGRIRADLDRRCGPARRSGLPVVHMLWLAAAACLVAAVLLPPRTAPRAAELAALPSLTSGEAAEIVAAYAVLAWDSPVDYTLEAVDASLDSVERALRREPGSTTLLPWGPDDDWDVPLTTDDGSSQSGARHGCFAPRRV